MIRFYIFYFLCFIIIAAQQVIAKVEYSTAVKFDVLNPSYDHNTIVINKFLEEQRSTYIVFITDIEGNRYIIKQERSATVPKQFKVVCEMLCSHVAYEMGVPAQHVCIIPAGYHFPGKLITKRTATIHKFIPGLTVRNLEKNSYARIDIKQSNLVDLPFEKQGLHRVVIKNMSIHPDLPLIAALDTFFGNRDRNKGNIIFNSNENRFYAIDMSLIYDTNNNKKSIVLLACEQLQLMINKKEIFNKEELDALKIYTETLKNLVHNFPPQTTYKLLKEYMYKAGLNDPEIYSLSEVFLLLKDYKRRIYVTYKEVEQLLLLLSKIVYE